MDTPARRTSSRLSLSRKFSQSASKTSSRCSTKSADNPANETNKRLMNELKDNPFLVTSLTLAEEDDLLSAAPDALSLASRDSPELKPTIPTIPECIELSSESESEVTPKKKQQQQDQNFNFFTPLKSRKKTATIASSSGLGVSTLKSKTVSSSKTVRSTARDSSKVKKVRKQICKSSNIKMLTNKYFDESQKRIPTFFQKKEEGEGKVGYHTVVKRSLMPAINTGDENMEDFLAVEVTEGAEPLRPSQIEGPPISQLTVDDPQKILERIEAAQSHCIDDQVEAINMEQDQVAVVIPHDEPDIDSGISHSTTARKPTKTPASKRKPPASTISKSTKRKTRGPVIVPKYKIVAGTNFAVDAFRYGDIDGVTHYFLSHYHADHYIGLKKSFRSGPLIMSPITAALVEAFIHVDRKHYILIELHQTIELDGVKITALDANHCPGALLFLFQLPSGTNVLHTGDFRASPAMEEYSELWNVDIHLLYLDTTYLSTKYCFKEQWQSVSDAVHEVRTFLKRNIGANFLIVCGSYLVGKEKVWLELVEQFGFRVWTEPNRRKAIDAVASVSASEQTPALVTKAIVDDPRDAQIHVLSMGKLSYDELVAYMDEFPERDCVLALRPSGWEKNSRPQYRGRINIVGIEYSEHSSYDELRRFVRFLRPREVISTVPYGNTNMNRTPQVPASWYQGKIRPERPSLQTAITSYFKLGGEKGKNEETAQKEVEQEEVCAPVDQVKEVEPAKDDYTIAEEVLDSDSDWM